MRIWLENTFNSTDVAEWELEDERKRSAEIDFIVNSFGDENPKGKQDMLNRCPTDGWREDIERWGELGILN